MLCHAIETAGLTRRFGTRTAVDGVSLTVPARSVYGFLGRNGAGKTTTLRLLLGLLNPHAGTVRIHGIGLAVDRLAAARQVGAILESHGFYANLSGRENLDLGRRLLGLSWTEVDRVLEAVDLDAHARHRVSDYSLGMRQRLGLARAMLGAPPVLVLDEPTNGLDSEGIVEMRGFLRELPDRTGAAVLLSSHLLGEIDQVATHVGILCEGRLVLEGSFAELRASQGTEIEVGTDDQARAAEVARAHGFDIECREDALVARLGPGTATRPASAALNRALCVAGVRVHALTLREPSPDALYRQAGQPPALV